MPHTSTVSRSSSTLNNPRGRQRSDLTEDEASISETQTTLGLKEKDKHAHAHPSTRSKGHTTSKPLTSNDATSEPIASIVGGFFAAVTLAISHHFFLAFLNNRNIDEYPQYWLKNANNAFSAMFSVCNAFVATYALTQMKWRAVRDKPLSIGIIDNLFALPSPVPLIKTVTSTRLWSLKLFLPPILVTTFIQSVALVSVFAPNALTVARSADISRDIPVPTLNLPQVPLGSMSSGISAGPNSAFNFTANSGSWTTIFSSIMVQSPLLNWKIPPECGAACKFDLVYEGPGLQCKDTPSEPPPYTGKDEPTLVYNATSTFYPQKIYSSYELRIGYITTNDQGVNIGGGGSVHCVFRNATYKASFQVENNTMHVNHSIQAYGGFLGLSDYGYSKECEGMVASSGFIPPCETNVLNTFAMCAVFASALTGQMQFNVPAEDPTGINGRINVALTDLLFSHGSRDLTEYFHLKVSNLSESLVSLFSSLTLGSIPYQNDTTTVLAVIWDGSYAWSYTVWILWAVYFPTLLLASLVMLSGLLSIRSNKRGMDEKFSDFLITTRNTELDVVCINTEDFAEFQQLRLLYGRDGTFSVASGVYAVSGPLYASHKNFPVP